MKTLQSLTIAGLLLLLSAGTALALSTTVYLDVTNNTSKSITVSISVDDGSGSGSATIASGGSHTFKFYNTLWYMKKKTHYNKITLSYDGKKAKTYTYEVRNEIDLIDDWLLFTNKLYQTSSPMECSVSLSTDTYIYDYQPKGTMTVNSCYQ